MTSEMGMIAVGGTVVLISILIPVVALVVVAKSKGPEPQSKSDES